MSSRRILSNSNLAPIQKNAVNPFDSFNSDTVNLLTRTVSGNADIVVKGLDVISNDKQDYLNATNLANDFGKSQLDFNSKWKSENVVWSETGIQFGLPTGLNYGNAYIESKLNTDEFNYLFSGQGNVVRDFEVSFKLLGGAPKNIAITINDTAFNIDHPVANTSNIYKVRLTRNLVNDTSKNGLTFKINVVFDSDDKHTTNSTTVDEDTSYSTYAKISDLKCNLVESGNKALGKAMSPVNGIYAYNGIHMTKTLKITPGIAIKDDVMLQMLNKTYVDKDATIELNVSDDNAWIKGKAYTKLDFADRLQYAYQVNGLNDTEESARKECYFDDDGHLYVKLGADDTGTIQTSPLIDDYQFNKNFDTLIYLDDYKDEKDSVGNYIFRSSKTQSKGTYGGKNLLIVYIDDNGKEIVVGRTQVTLIDGYVDKFYISLNPAQLPETFNIHVADGNISDRVKAYLTAGPIKVSGNPSNYITTSVKWAYVVVYYSYFKNPKPNISYIGLVDENDLNDVKYREDYLILAKVRFVDPYTVDIISYEDRQMNQLPNADMINYSSVCQYPELWNGTVPNSVRDAINSLINQTNERDAKTNLKHDAYKEVDTSSRLTNNDADSGVEKTPVITISEDNHLTRRIRDTNLSIVVTNLETNTKLAGDIDVGSVFTFDRDLNVYLNEDNTWAFDNTITKLGKYTYSTKTFTEKYISFNNVAPYQFIDPADGNKILKVDYGYERDELLYPTAPSLKKEDEKFVDTDDGTKGDKYLLSYDTPYGIKKSDILKAKGILDASTTSALNTVLMTLGATVNGKIDEKAYDNNILSGVTFTTGTEDLNNIAFKKLADVCDAVTKDQDKIDVSVCKLLSGYTFKLPTDNVQLLKVLIVKLAGTIKAESDPEKFNYLCILMNTITGDSKYSIFNYPEDKAKQAYILKDIVLAFGGYIIAYDGEGTRYEYRSETPFISELMNKIKFDPENDDPHDLIDGVLETVKKYYNTIGIDTVIDKMNSYQNHFSYIKWNDELLSTREFLKTLDKLPPDETVIADNVAIFKDADGHIGDSNIVASHIITRNTDLEDSKPGYIPEFRSVDTINSTRVIGSSGLTVSEVKIWMSKLLNLSTEGNIVTFKGSDGTIKDSGIPLKNTPYCNVSSESGYISKFTDKKGTQSQITKSSISESYIQQQLVKIPLDTTKGNVAIYDDTKGTIKDSGETIESLKDFRTVIHKTLHEGFTGAIHSIETIAEEGTDGALSGDKGWSGNHYFLNTINGTAYAAKWADLAEYYKVPEGIYYEVGTLVKFGNQYINEEGEVITDENAEIVICQPGDACNAVISVGGESGTAAYILNESESRGSQLIALSGRVKIRVDGPVSKFDYLTLSDVIPGVACVVSNINTQKVIGRALQSKSTDGVSTVLCSTSFTLTGTKYDTKPNRNISVNDVAMFGNNKEITSTGIQKNKIILRKRSGENDDVGDGYDTTREYIVEFGEVEKYSGEFEGGNRLIKNSGIKTDDLTNAVNNIPKESIMDDVAIFGNNTGKIIDSGVSTTNVATVENPDSVTKNVIVKFGELDAVTKTRNILDFNYTDRNGKSGKLYEDTLKNLLNKIPTSTKTDALVTFDDKGNMVNSDITIEEIESVLVHKTLDEGFGTSKERSIEAIVGKGVDGALSGDKGWSGTHYFKNTLYGTVLKAQYGDLAEYYKTDLPSGSEYDLGTLIMFGGTEEITEASNGRVNGVISSTKQAGMIMNTKGDLTGYQLVALEGKIQIKVIGKVSKFDYLTLSSTPGVATATTDCHNNTIIARALQSSSAEGIKLIKAVTKFEL